MCICLYVCVCVNVFLLKFLFLCILYIHNVDKLVACMLFTSKYICIGDAYFRAFLCYFLQESILTTAFGWIELRKQM